MSDAYELEIEGLGEDSEDPNEATIDKNTKKKIFWLPQDFSIRCNRHKGDKLEKAQ